MPQSTECTSCGAPLWGTQEPQLCGSCMPGPTFTCPNCHRGFNVTSIAEKRRLETLWHKAPDGKLCNPQEGYHP